MVISVPQYQLRWGTERLRLLIADLVKEGVLNPNYIWILWYSLCLKPQLMSSIKKDIPFVIAPLLDIVILMDDI